MTDIELYQTNPGSWLVNGNIVNDELMIKENYSLYHSILVDVPVDYMNILAPNKANCGEDGTTNGFSSYNGANISSSSAWCAQGSKSIRVITNGSQSNQGIITAAPYETVTPGEDYTEQITVRGVGSFDIAMSVYSSGGSVLDSVVETLELTPYYPEDTAIVSMGMPDNAAYVRTHVSAQGITATTFYVDRQQINPGGEPYPWIPGQTSYNSVNPIVGDTFIRVQTPGESSGEGIQEQPTTVDVNPGDSVWHSLYVGNGSGTVVLVVYERDNNGNIINTNTSDPLSLNNTLQPLELNTIIESGDLVSFKVLTNTEQEIDFVINGVYINKGDTPRNGLNLADPNIIGTGSEGVLDGFLPQPYPGDTIISIESIVESLELKYDVPYVPTPVETYIPIISSTGSMKIIAYQIDSTNPILVTNDGTFVFGDLTLGILFDDMGNRYILQR